MERWYTTDRFRIWVLRFLTIGLIAQAFPVLLRDNDYQWHANLGKYFLAGDPFKAAGEWYLLSRAMFNVIPALMPQMLGKALIALVALACVVYSVRAFANMTRDQGPIPWRLQFAVVTFAMIAMVPFINRDLDDAGLQCLLLGMLAAAGSLLWQGRAWSAGFWLGTAVAYKVTPILFLPLLLWKRQWRTALAMTLATIGWNVLPAAYVGWDKTVECHQLTWDKLRMRQTRDIAENGVEPPMTRNRGLMAVCARYLQTYPAGHPLYQDHPLFVQFASFDLDTARMLAQAAMATLGLAVAWGMRRRWTVRDARLPYEWAAACIFVAIMSPMCWRQHLVLAVPAGYLLWRAVLTHQTGSPFLRRAAILLAVVALAPQREVFGLELTEVFESYKFESFAMLGYVALLFRIAPDSSLGQNADTPILVSDQSTSAHRQAA